MSQLDLAVAAGTTPRHLCFIETGRSRQGRDLIPQPADALTVPPPERKTLLAAAGLREDTDIRVMTQPDTVTSCQSPPLRLRLLPKAWPGAVSPT